MADVYVPPQCEINAAPSLDDTRTIFLFFTILWCVLNVCNLFRAGGMLLYRDGVYVLIVFAFAALGFVLWALTNPDHPCGGSVASCSTISCVCGNLIWQGYVWMFVVIILNAYILLKGLARNLTHFLTKLPNRDKRESRVEQSLWGSLILFVALLLTSITGIFPSLKRDPQDQDEVLKAGMEAGHTFGVAGGAMLGVVGVVWCKVRTWLFYKNVLQQLRKDKEQAVNNNNDDQHKEVRILEYETMLTRRNREHSFLIFDALVMVLMLVFAIMFAISSNHVPVMYESHLCSKWETENDCQGDTTDLSDLELDPWVCVWVDNSATGQAALQANFANTNDCAYGCCFSNEACYNTTRHPDIANHLTQTKPNDRGKCRANQNARVMVLEFLVLVYLLLCMANHLSSKVHDDVFLEIAKGGPLAAKFNSDFQWWWMVNPFSSTYVLSAWATHAHNRTFDGEDNLHLMKHHHVTTLTRLDTDTDTDTSLYSAGT